MDINGKVAIVTGGGSGLGAGTARMLMEAGAKVAVLDINEDGMKPLAEAGATAIRCDVTSADDASAAIERVASELGEPRILVNCAGIAPASRVVGREGPHDLGMFEKVIAVNVIGSFNMLRLCAHRMSTLDPVTDDGERGVIISTASVAAEDGQIGQAAYAASKGAIKALALPVAREVARFGIRVMTIAPGIFGTPMLGAMPQEVQDSLAAAVPFPKRLGTAQDYAMLARHIIENGMLNGEMIRLDGAIRLAPK